MEFSYNIASLAFLLHTSSSISVKLASLTVPRLSCAFAIGLLYCFDLGASFYSPRFAVSPFSRRRFIGLYPLLPNDGNPRILPITAGSSG